MFVRAKAYGSLFAALAGLALVSSTSATAHAGPASSATATAAARSDQGQSQSESQGQDNTHDGGHDLTRPTGKRRYIALSYNPFTIQTARWGGTIEGVLASHHALVLSPFYVHTRTNADSNNVFRGVGGELGYRYYSGEKGTRGFYVGPSLLLGAYDAVPARGDTVHYTNVGVALDVGYQAVLADRWVVGLGTGLQYTVPSTSFPPQELPASIYAAKGLRPRLLLALGFTF